MMQLGKITRVLPRSHRAECAVLMVSEASSEYQSQWAAIVSISAKIGCTPKSLRRWVRQQELDRLVEIEGKNPAQVAREVGIAEQTMSNWRKAYKAGKPATLEQMDLSHLKAE